MNNPQIYSDGVVNSIQDSPLRVQNKILGALKNLGGEAAELNNDTVADVTDSASTVLSANAARKFLSIQNIGGSKVYIRFGADPVITGTKRFSFILKPAASADSGDGGVVTLQGYTGDVRVVCASSDTTTVAVSEFN
jgi:hypothetical protein